MLPLALDFEGRDVLVIGFGRVGAHKARQLLEAGARVRVITTEVLAEVPEGLASLEVRPFVASDVEGAWFVVSATGVPEVNDVVVANCEARQIFYNVVDDLARCAVHFMALHRDGEVVVAISSNGASPSLAQWVRDTCAAALPRGLGGVARQLRADRAALHARGESAERDWSERLHELLRALR
jgi:siroheme synthase-like protein